ncbi:MAG: hypothetical protein BWK75_04095 [Candidatus Altiarchaeales archaeon A3]|nr:MAG: hypothetical protein BWK75_04095 [Candidatus Altiarchaeales archaeon A3]
MFSWDDVPGNNTELIKFLKDDLKIEWAENAEIKKSDNDRIITLVNKNKKNSITLNLNKKENNVTLEIADGKTYKYLLKEENSKLNIYSEYIKNKSKEGNITVLDPSCGSGIFLVKFFERLVKERESELGEGKSLDIYKKSDLLKKSIHGIDTDPNALRIAAFSLYLKIFDRVNPEILKKVLEKCEEKKEHFMFPGLKEHNLIQGNSLFDEDIFKGKKFDLILGNPPWDYDFSENERRLIDRKWPDVSDYQSSQCFLFKIDDWMNENSIVGMVVNLSNFTNQNAECFRKLLLEKYSIKKFLNLINIKKITFKDGSESACVLIFNKDHDIEENDIKFIVPDMTHFSELTREIVVKDDDIAKVRQSGLSEETWHLSILGLNKYLKLIERIESDVYLFSLTPEYKQYLQCSDVDDELKNEFKESKCFLSNEAKLSRIDEKKWNIVDFNREYKIKDVGVQLNIYEKRIALERYSETFEQGATFYSMEKHGYLFGWDDIPENNGDLLKFLKENILVDWIKNPEIKKSNDENAVTITELENSIILKRKLTEKKVIITYNRETSNFILKMVKGTFNVYNPDYNNIAKKKYEGIKKEDNNYFPKIQSLGGLKPYLCPQLEGYIKYGPHLEKARKFNIFLDNKLVINRGWPIKSFSVSDTIIFSSSFYIFKPDKKFPSDYIHLFKAILNSKLAYFYLRSKYLQRLKGNHTKVNLVDLKKFPIPYLKDEKIIKEIINFVSKIKEENDIEKYQSQIDELVFDLYELDYYERQQIKDYYKIYKQKRQNNNLVSTDDMNEYINEFIDSFNLFIEKGYFLNAKFYICNFLGSLVKFEFSKEKKETEPEYSKLKRLISIILHEKISDIKNVLKEEEMRIYDNNVLYLYKSNHIKDWTRTKALDDVKREFGLIYKNLPD